jgi:phage terminase large subunit
VLDQTRSYQAEALDLMAEPGQFALMWANGTAKTTTAALAVLWFLDCYPGKVLTTAATWSQLQEQLWREIRTWASRAKGPIASNQVTVGKTQIDISPDWAAFGRAFDREGSFEGVHAKYVMVLMDEAKAIAPGAFEESQRILRGNADTKLWWLALSSPGSPSGPFYDIVHGSMAHRWQTLRLSAYECERISLDQIARDALDLGEASPLFTTMTLGEFPDVADDTLIPLSWAEAAVDRNVSVEGSSVAACDVARFGSDSTVFARFDGRKASIPTVYSGKDLMQTAGRVVQLRKDVDRIAIDDAGLGGGVTDRCRELSVSGLRPLNAGSKAKHSDEFADLGSEMAWNLRRAFEETYLNRDDPDLGLSIPDDKRLVHELTSRKYDYRSDGRIKIESKSDMRRRGERSPDRADALAMAWWIRARRSGMDSEILRANLEAVHRGPGEIIATMDF